MGHIRSFNEYQKCIELSKNESLTYQKLWDTAKSELRGI